MGRRALRKVDPSLDLAAFLFELDQLTPPLEPCDFFGGPAPLEVEVGSGKGLFLATAAAEQRDRNYLGIELARKYARYAAARLAKHQLENACLICGDAVRIFREFLTAETAAAVHVYFPDPWWKKRHRKRRVIQADFLKDVERVLQTEGRLHFWTDVEEYFSESIDLVRATTALAGPYVVPEVGAAHDLDFRTHFERRMRQSDRPVFRAEFEKT